MSAIAAAIIQAKGWRRRLIALAAGATGALAMAPFHFFLGLAIPATVAIWLIDGSASKIQTPPVGRFGRATAPILPHAARRAFAVGWWWGFGYFLAGLWWLGAAFLVEAEAFAWAMPFGVIGLPALLAFFPALGFLLARLLWTPGASRIFAFAAALTLAEWLRGHVLTGFPWNTFGMALGGNLVLAQLASVIGLYGLTVIALVLSSVPAVLGGPIAPRESGARRPVAAFGAAVLALAAIYGFGALRLALADRGAVQGVELAIMQPNLAQDAKFRPENRDAILAHYLKLSAAAKGPAKNSANSNELTTTVFVWPESAFPFILSHDPEALADIGAFLPLGAVLVTGAAREDDVLPIVHAALGLPSPPTRYFNAIQVIANGGLILDSYDKVHLVPFGEYLPLQSMLNSLGLHHFVHVPGGFEAGAARKTLAVPGLPEVAPLICYEAIFPGEVMPQPAGAKRPGVLLNVTNDAWFGMTAGPHQHFAQARLRAIEEGLPMIRAANTGISAIIDPYGQILEQLPLGAEGLLEGTLPQAIAPPFFARWPFASSFSVWFAALLVALTARARV
ncbi:apolipoprotein N-acyltransferase [Methylocapsa aurea]|uniref:apolipoprotein N-acyltransferase n=1 Tax=Methylocapsa aurea TaxID=663610 RepID=UPI0005635093|nr:apolipoprotein N-acyltransferase [Methylocapsa aurea]